MGEAMEELRGPDLKEGVALDALPDGEPFAAHADGQPVVVVRRGAEVLAIGGSCTHYGGPLADGLVVGDTIRCPWHHACFSLRTGEATGAPALNPVARWRLEVREGRVHAIGSETLRPLDPAGRAAVPATTASTTAPVMGIVGAGAAGSAAAEQLRREGHTGRIVVIDPDGAAPYDRPNLSKDYLAGNAPEEWIPLRPSGFHEEHGIERITAAVESIDGRARSVTLDDGRAIGYDALLLATGASPIRLPVPGADLDHVHVLRSLAHCRAIIGAAEAADRAVVVGASFIGMEVAAALRARGLDVTVVAPESVPFERTLGREIGRRILDVHEANGVAFRPGRTVRQIEPAYVVLDDDTRLNADLVVVGIGVRPETALAEAAGAAVEDGVVVDAYLETTVPGIFAAGDIARWPAPVPEGRIRLEHWAVAQRLGQAAARNMLGARRPFTDVPFFWTAHFGLAVGYTGYAGEWSAAAVDSDDDGGLTVRYGRGGHTVAVATIGRDLESLEAEAQLEGVARTAAGAVAG